MANKLELTWYGKENKVLVEPRLLLEDKQLSNCPDGEACDNMLIHGDNLLALKALSTIYKGKIKCIYIDPPYNTGAAFAHYDDNLEHSVWLSLMKDRLYYLRLLLSNEGTIWINLDDNEAHYCKVMCDELFGRNNFLADVIWEKADSPKMDAKFFSSRHDHLLVYSKNIEFVKLNKLFPDELPKQYNKLSEDGRHYYLKPLRAMGVDGYREKRPSLYYGVTAPDGTIVFPKNQDGSDSRWRWSKEKLENERHRLEWVKGQKGWSLYFRIYSDDSNGIPPETIWKCDSVGSNRTSKKEVKELFGSTNTFDTPKPEALICRVLKIATNEGDFVLDSFLGSGTTAAVAHKMNRRWIGVELGVHAYTHCKVRMDKVINGDQGGVSKLVNWKGGGAYKFYELAPTLINIDAFGEPIINKEYNPDMLAAAVAMHEGCKYTPDKEMFWKQAKASENSYLFTTTRCVTHEFLHTIHETMKEDEFLVIACKSFVAGADKMYSNIKVKKIPQMLLERCEFGKDNYNLNIVNPPVYEDDEEVTEDE